MSYKFEDFYVGQLVRVRDWDDMVNEYGLDANGHIASPIDPFPRDWIKYCGEEGGISSINGNLIVVDGIDDPDLYWTDLEPVEVPETINDFSVDGFLEMLGVQKS